MTTPSLAKENQERAKIMKEEAALREQERAATMHGLALNELAQPRGRFAEAEGKQFVVGSTPGPIYPALPSGPWSGADPVPDEPPLGYSVDDMPELATGLSSLSPVATGRTSDAPSSFVEGDEPRSVDVRPSSSPTPGVGQPSSPEGEPNA
jgi:hypothetical protein